MKTDGVSVKDTPFQAAIDSFQGKVRLPTRHYTDVMEQAHARAFVVAGAMQDDLIAGFQEAINKALTQGTTLAEFRKDFDKLVAAHGWNYNGSREWRTRTIFHTNIRTSYMSGKWEEAQRTKARRPYGRYVAVKDNRTRPEHAIWHGKVVLLDDPWWNTHWPPNGWGCRCTMQTVSERELERNGWDVWTPPTDKFTTAVLQTPSGPMPVKTVPGVDPGFAYNPGRASFGTRLSEQAVRDLRADGTWKNWKRLTPGDWQSARRPEEMPLDIPRAKLAEAAATPDDMVRLTQKAAGGAEVLIASPDGGAVFIEAAFLAAHIPMNRSPFVPMLREVIEDPYEVWVSVEEHEATGRVELRKRYLKLVQVGPKKQSLYLVAQVVKGVFVGWTFVPASSPSVLKNQRVGKLLWGR